MPTLFSTAPSTDLLLSAGSSAAENLSGFSGWAVRLMEALGPLGVGFLVFLDNIFPPIPSELVLPLAGFTASQGSMNIVLAIIFATVGSVVGAVILWALGKRIGLERISRIAVKMPLVDVDDVHKTVGWFDKHGDKAVFFGRMVPIFRSLISIPGRHAEHVDHQVPGADHGRQRDSGTPFSSSPASTSVRTGRSWRPTPVTSRLWSSLLWSSSLWCGSCSRSASAHEPRPRIAPMPPAKTPKAQPTRTGAEPSVRFSSQLRPSQPGCCGVFLRNFLTGAHRPGCGAFAEG